MLHSSDELLSRTVDLGNTSRSVSTTDTVSMIWRGLCADSDQATSADFTSMWDHRLWRKEKMCANVKSRRVATLLDGYASCIT
jgi:hypothetical protein